MQWDQSGSAYVSVCLSAHGEQSRPTGGRTVSVALTVFETFITSTTNSFTGLCDERHGTDDRRTDSEQYRQHLRGFSTDDAVSSRVERRSMPTALQ